jgi:hypothetical protein
METRVYSFRLACSDSCLMASDFVVDDHVITSSIHMILARTRIGGYYTVEISQDHIWCRTDEGCPQPYVVGAEVSN